MLSGESVVQDMIPASPKVRVNPFSTNVDTPQRDSHWVGPSGRAILRSCVILRVLAGCAAG